MLVYRLWVVTDPGILSLHVKLTRNLEIISHIVLIGTWKIKYSLTKKNIYTYLI